MSEKCLPFLLAKTEQNRTFASQIKMSFISIINMEIQGKIIQILPEQGGISKAGNEWKKQEYVLETHD